MTLHLVKWHDQDDKGHYHEAFSRFVDAQKKVRELAKDPRIEIKDNGEGPITTVKPKSQSDVIQLINSL